MNISVQGNKLKYSFFALVGYNTIGGPTSTKVMADIQKLLLLNVDPYFWIENREAQALKW